MPGTLPMSQALPPRAAADGLRVLFRIAEAWNMSGAELQRLLAVPKPTLDRWKRDPGRARLDEDKLERLSYVFGIWKALEVLLPKKEAARTWVRRPNRATLFGGRTPIDRMLSGRVADLYEVRTWLDARRGVWS